MYPNKIRSYFLPLALFSTFTGLVVFLWNEFSPERFRAELSWGIWLFFIITTILIHSILTNAANKNPKKFILAFMLTTAVKLFGFLILILIYALIRREAALGFTLLFLTMYLFYSGFEVVTLLKFFKKQKQ